MQSAVKMVSKRFSKLLIRGKVYAKMFPKQDIIRDFLFQTVCEVIDLSLI